MGPSQPAILGRGAEVEVDEDGEGGWCRKVCETNNAYPKTHATTRLVPAEVWLFLAAEASTAEVRFLGGSEALAAEVRINSAILANKFWD